MAEALLDVRGIRVEYWGAAAVQEATLRVEPGEVVAVLGPNGAGKTSLLNAVMRLVPLAGGEVLLDGRSLTGVPAWQAARLGLGYVPEGRRVFADLTVRENLRAGGYARGQDTALIERLLDRFPVLRQRADQHAWSLSGGEQQMLAIARALVGRPKVLLLDEPSMGLAPKVVDQLYELLAELAGTGLAILLVEQRVENALDLAATVHVLRQGVIDVSGPSARMRTHPALAGGYL